MTPIWSWDFMAVWIAWSFGRSCLFENLEMPFFGHSVFFLNPLSPYPNPTNLHLKRFSIKNMFLPGAVASCCSSPCFLLLFFVSSSFFSCSLFPPYPLLRFSFLFSLPLHFSPRLFVFLLLAVFFLCSSLFSLASSVLTLLSSVVPLPSLLIVSLLLFFLNPWSPYPNPTNIHLKQCSIKNAFFARSGCVMLCFFLFSCPFCFSFFFFSFPPLSSSTFLLFAFSPFPSFSSSFCFPSLFPLASSVFPLPFSAFPLLFSHCLSFFFFSLFSPVLSTSFLFSLSSSLLSFPLLSPPFPFFLFSPPSSLFSLLFSLPFFPFFPFYPLPSSSFSFLCFSFLISFFNFTLFFHVVFSLLLSCFAFSLLLFCFSFLSPSFLFSGLLLSFLGLLASIFFSFSLVLFLLFSLLLSSLFLCFPFLLAPWLSLLSTIFVFSVLFFFWATSLV